jgi:hypothetical protein
MAKYMAATGYNAVQQYMMTTAVAAVLALLITT